MHECHILHHEPYEKDCIKEPYNIRTYYFSETDQYVFSYLTEDFGIQTVIYDKNMANMVDIETPLYRLQRVFNGCDEFYYYSIIYSEIKKRYYVISDSDCSNYGHFFPLIEEEIEEEEESGIEEDKGEEKEEETIEEKEIVSEIGEETYNCNLEKCDECNSESEELNLCKKCNNDKCYYFLNTGGNSLSNQYFKCYNERTKP